MGAREVHPATVVAIEDPEQRGRIKVACSALLGTEDEALPMWVPPVAEWGWFFVPDIGETVDVEFISDEDDDESRSMASIANNDIRWRGRHWNGTGDGARPIPDDFKTNYGKRRGFATPGGHIMMFDDTPGKRKWSMTWASGEGKFAYQAFDEDGSFICANANGSLLYHNAKEKESSWVDEHGNSIRLSATGISWIDKHGNFIESKDGAIQVCSPAAVTVSCKDATIDAGNIELAPPALDHLIKGETFMTYFAAHVHPTAMGPSGPPVPTGAEATLLSTKAKVGG